MTVANANDGSSISLSAPTSSIAAVVLGMHRSGTSLLASLLANAGFSLPKNLLGPQIGNELGHFESRVLVECNDRFLKALGSEWNDWQNLRQPSPSEQAQYVGELSRTIISEFDNAGRVVIKDPRFCRLFPFLRAALSSLHYQPYVIIPFRHYEEVAASLHARDGILEEHAIALWLRHVLDAEYSSRQNARVFISIDRILSDWDSQAKVLFDSLGVERVSTANSHSLIRQDMRHHKVPVPEKGSGCSLNLLADKALAALKCLESQTGDCGAMHELDRVRKSFDSASSTLLIAWDDATGDVSSLRKTCATALSNVVAQVERIEKLSEDLEAMQLERDSALADSKIFSEDLLQTRSAYLGLQQELTSTRNDKLAMVEQLKASQNERNSMEAKLQAYETQTEGLAATVRALVAKIDATVKHSSGLSDSVESRLSQKLGELQVALKYEQQARASAESAAEALREDLDKARADQSRLFQQAESYWNIAKDLQESLSSPLAALKTYVRKTSLPAIARPVEPRENVAGASNATVRTALAPEELDEISAAEIFDRDWYLKAYPDVARSKVDPLAHFLSYGMHEGRDASATFSPEWYLRYNPDVARAGMNPLLHFAKWGRSEKRRTRRPQWVPRDLSVYSAEEISTLRDAALGMSIDVSGVRVAVGIVTYNNPQSDVDVLLRSTSLALSSFTSNVSVYLVENGTTPRSAMAGVANIMESKGNVGFGRAHNRLMEAAFADGADYYVAANPDGLFHPGAIRALVQCAVASKDMAIVEAIQFPDEHPKVYDALTFDTPWISGACFLLPKVVYESIGGFDDDFFMYCEDVDLSWRARDAGISLKFCPRAIFYHDTTDRNFDLKVHSRFLTSGLILARKWKSGPFEEFVLGEFKKHGLQAPTLPSIKPREFATVRPDFDNFFSFGPTRW